MTSTAGVVPERVTPRIDSEAICPRGGGLLVWHELRAGCRRRRVQRPELRCQQASVSNRYGLGRQPCNEQSDSLLF